MLKTVVRNVLSNWLGYVVAVVVGFFLSPYLVRRLGNEQYGTWTMIVALTGYIRLLDLGIYQGVLQYVTRYRSQGKVAEINEIVSTALGALALAAALGVVASAVMAGLYPRYFATENLSVWRVQVALLIVGVSVAVTVPFEIYNAIICSCHSFHVMNVISIGVRLASAGALVWALSRGMGLLAVATITLGVNLLAEAPRVWVAHRLVPGLRERPQNVTRSAGRQLFGYGLWMFVMRISSMLFVNIDLVLIGFFYGPVGATFYGIALTLISYAIMAIQGLSFVLGPVAIEGDARAEPWRLRSILLRASRVGLVLGGTFFVCFLFWGKEFIAEWMGPEYVSGRSFSSSAAILGVAAVGRVLGAGLIGPAQVLLGTRRVRPLALITLAQGLLAAVAAALCAKYVGPIAAAAAASIGMVGAHAAVTVYACRVTKTGARTFALGTILPVLVALGGTALAAGGIRQAVVTSGWVGIFLRIGLTVLVASLAGGYLCFDRSERQALVQWLVRRFRGCPEGSAEG